MRKDMAKVVTERSRSGWKGVATLSKKSKSKKYSAKISNAIRTLEDAENQDDLESPRRVSAGRSQYDNPRTQSFNYGPIRRFLQSRVGRSWDDVYSEIRQTLDPRSPVDRTVLQIIDFSIEKTRYGADGKTIVVVTAYTSGERPPLGPYYIDPEGILRATSRRRRWKPALTKRQREKVNALRIFGSFEPHRLDHILILSDTTLAENIDGTWVIRSYTKLSEFDRVDEYTYTNRLGVLHSHPVFRWQKGPVRRELKATRNAGKRELKLIESWIRKGQWRYEVVDNQIK